MAAFQQPHFEIRRAAEEETDVIGDLRLASMLAVELPGHSLATVGAVLEALPDVDAGLVASGHYLLADADGDLIGGAGWSVLPLSFRSEPLLSADGRPADLSLGVRSVLIRGFFLDPDMGRRGAGAALLARIEADAARGGYDSAELVVPASSQVHYRGLGFRPMAKLWLRIGRNSVLPLLQMRRCFPARLADAA
jgi:GNAT superfamily N-acetyltransferase